MLPRPSRVLVTNPDRQLPCHFSKTVLRIPSKRELPVFLCQRYEPVPPAIGKLAFAQRSGAMKAPVGLLSDRTVLRKQDGGASPRQVRVCGSCGTKKLWSETGLRQWKGRFHRCTVLWHSLCRLNTLAVGNALPQKSSDGCLGIFYLWRTVQDGNRICFPRKVFHCISAESVFQ